MKKTTASRITGAARGRQALARDTRLLAEHGNQRHRFRCHGSALQQQLREDVLSGFTNGKTPTQVRLSRDICRQARLTTQEFSGHLWHERRRRERAENAEECHQRMQFVTAPVAQEEGGEEEGGEEEGGQGEQEQARQTTVLAIALATANDLVNGATLFQRMTVWIALAQFCRSASKLPTVWTTVWTN